MKGLWAVVTAILFGIQAAADPQMTQTLNSFRAENGRTPLAYPQVLEGAALRHAKDMAQAGIFSHSGSDGSDVADRVGDAGYGWCFVAENIAKGQVSLSEVMADWAASPGHRRNMLASDADEFALVHGADNIWVMVLAAPGC